MSRRRPSTDSAPSVTRPDQKRAKKGPKSKAEKSRGSSSARAPKRPKVERRAHVERDRSSHRLRPLYWTAIVLVSIATLSVGAAWALRQPFVSVRHVTFVGLRHETSAQVLAASGLNAHPPMINVSASALERRLVGFAWIKGLEVVKHWPDSLVVMVSERVAIAVAFDPTHVLRYVDAQGHELGPATLHVNLPTLQYLHPLKATWPYRRAGRAAALVASELPRAFTSQVSVITENARGIVTLQMTTPVSFILGPPTDLRDKFVSIASVIAHSSLRPGDVIDVSVPGALAVTGQPPS